MRRGAWFDMFKRTLVLAGVITIIRYALLVNLYIPDWVKFPERESIYERFSPWLVSRRSPVF